jgi:hypothetical protein
MSMTTRPLCRRKIRRKTAQTTGETAEFETFGACGSTTIVLMDKRRPQLDSRHQIGPETTLHKVLIIVESGSRGGE